MFQYIKSFIPLAAALLLTSCATIINKPMHNIKVHTVKPVKIAYNDTAVNTVDNMAMLTVLRSNSPLVLNVISDSSQRAIHVKPRLAPEVYYNVVTYGLGVIVDLWSPKRYAYPANIYLNNVDSIIQTSKIKLYHKAGDTYLHLSIPYVNSFLLQPIGESKKSKTGFLGFAAGIDYYYGANKFISLTAMAATPSIAPVPAPVHYSGEYDLYNTLGINAANNHRFKRFVLGYGLAYARNSFIHHYQDTVLSKVYNHKYTKTSHSIGLIVPAYYQLGKSFHVGVLYRPTFIRLNSTVTFKYEHVLSLGLAWKIKL